MVVKVTKVTTSLPSCGLTCGDAGGQLHFSPSSPRAGQERAGTGGVTAIAVIKQKGANGGGAGRARPALTEAH